MMLSGDNMEKIFLFIIIMIISSLFSKNKKKKAAERVYRTKEKTTYFDDKGSSASGSEVKKESLSQLQDLLSRYGADRKQVSSSERNVPVETSYETSAEEFFEEGYKPRFPQGESKVVYEDHSIHTADFAMEQKDTNYEDYESYDNMTARAAKAKEPAHSWNIPAEEIKPKIILSELFGSRNKLRKSIIAAEVLNRKYT